MTYDPTIDLLELCVIDDDLTPAWVLQRCDQTGQCWLWQGPVLRRPDGDRAVAKRQGKSTTAVRHIWTELRGPLPRSIIVRPVCGQGLCVRPSHLTIATPQDSSRDALRRGRLRPGGRGLTGAGHAHPRN